MLEINAMEGKHANCRKALFLRILEHWCGSQNTQVSEKRDETSCIY